MRATCYIAACFILVAQPAQAQIPAPVPAEGGNAVVLQGPPSVQPPSTTNAQGPVVYVLSQQPATSAERAPATSTWVQVVDSAAWPIVVLLALVLLTLNRRAQRFLSAVSNRITKVKGGPVEFDFTPEAAKDLRATIKQDLDEFCRAAENEYQRQIRAHDLDELMTVARHAVLDHLAVKAKETECRSTVHVPDVVIGGALYQLLNYHPDESGRGRRWSERYGLLGRAWRLRRSLFANEALGVGASSEDKANRLVTNWGMTQNEAERAASAGARQSFLCVILRVDNRAVGVLYFDSLKPSVFTAAGGHDFMADERLGLLPEVVKLAAHLEEAMKPLRAAGTYLEFSGSDA